MKPKDLLDRAARGDVRNVRFGDFRNLVEALGFELDHISGSHYIYIHQETKKLVNLQPEGNKAKAYQVRQVLGQVQRYSLKLKD